MHKSPSLQLTSPGRAYSRRDKVGMALIGAGLVALLGVMFGAGEASRTLSLWITMGCLTVGCGVLFAGHLTRAPGVDNNHVWFSPATARGMLGWILGIVFTGFYVMLYWAPHNLEYLIRMTDSLSYMLRHEAADRWFLYGFFYTMAVLLMGGRMLLKYRNSGYQMVRTVSVMFFQLGFAFLLPGLLKMLNEPEFYFSYFWPLKYDYLWPSSLDYFSSASNLGVFMVFWGAVGSLIATPILTYFFGKRWYCSWVCGCGGLAETAGDPFRHLSDKSLSAWKVERWMVHSVLVFVVLTTVLLWINSLSGGALLGNLSGRLAQLYGFFHRAHLRRSHRSRLLPHHGLPGLVPVRLPHGRGTGTPPEILFAVSHHDQRRAVYFLR